MYIISVVSIREKKLITWTYVQAILIFWFFFFQKMVAVNSLKYSKQRWITHENGSLILILTFRFLSLSFVSLSLIYFMRC